MPTLAEVIALHASIKHGVWLVEHGRESRSGRALPAQIFNTGREEDER